jgi:hypothetical protein
MHYGEQFASILPIWGEFLGADILMVILLFFSIKSVEIIKILVVFYSLHVCPWIPAEKEKCVLFFSDFSGKF